MTPLPPGSTIGILGSGQLGRMLAMAAARLGFKCHVYADAPGPAFDVAAAATVGGYGALEDLAGFAGAAAPSLAAASNFPAASFARGVDAVTYEFENVPVAAAQAIERVRAVPVLPRWNALYVAQDRLEEKAFIAGLGLRVAPFAPVPGESDLEPRLERVGFPAILKTRRLGYDGKGQIRVADLSAAHAAFASLGTADVIVEGVVDFAYEVSVLAVRSRSGEIRFYDVPVNTHEGGVLKTSAVPSPLPARHERLAREIAARIAEALDYVGVLAVEMFYVGERDAAPLVVNEIAPRVHNSGHWTLGACAVSQFENHIRAVAGWPLGSTDRHSDAVMTNLLGAEVHDWAALAAEPNACLHVYGKRDARPGRKMGHVTRLTPRSAPCL